MSRKSAIRKISTRNFQIAGDTAITATASCVILRNVWTPNSRYGRTSCIECSVPRAKIRTWGTRFHFRLDTLSLILVELLPSILSADFAHLADEVKAAEAGGGTVIHFDVMDGHFVPNLTIGTPVLESLRKVTTLPIDCHMMIENPDEFVEPFAEAGGDWMSVHYEVCPHLHRTLQLIRHHGMEPGVVINLATPVEQVIPVLDMVHHVLVMSINPGFGGQNFIHYALVKIRRLKELREELGLNYRIEVDGGVNHDTIGQVVEAGADLLVAGSAVFSDGRAEQNARELLQLAQMAAESA